ncbi:MAG: UDP-N-acetylmuramoyl-L-alanine--D-glutamate ligase [Aerococcus sp.]|nr:UDP-N-acetylmuramoyl-L-alanine--D-glutamate ligase [Aerococcus sp.]
MREAQVQEKMAGKKIFVLGIGKTGMSVANHLSQLGVHLTVFDDKKQSVTPEMQKLIDKAGVQFILGEPTTEELDSSFDLMIKNPGIPYTHPLVKKAMDLNISVVTDVEVSGWLSEAMIIGITGSNGKTSTTSLIAKILSESALTGKTYLGGNIGIPTLDISLQAKKADRLVLELSSFQLQGTSDFHPHIASLLNLYPTHLDYHGSMENYLEAKWHITKNQMAEDYLLLNADQPLLWEKRHDTEATVVPISMTMPELDPVGAWYDEQRETLNWGNETVAKRSSLVLPGNHNVQNALNALAVAKLLQVENETIQHVFEHFRGVKHRIQWVGDIRGRSFYNDSKATNNEAALTALNSFTRPVVWIAGGLDRHIPLDELKPALKHVKAVVVIGETAAKFKKLAQSVGIETIEEAEWIEDAVDKAYQLSAPEDVILLSPASASWDQYPSFEVRGDRFIQEVEQLMSKESKTAKGAL